jgi:hypothetical protein
MRAGPLAHLDCERTVNYVVSHSKARALSSIKVISSIILEDSTIAVFCRGATRVSFLKLCSSKSQFLSSVTRIPGIMFGRRLESEISETSSNRNWPSSKAVSFLLIRFTRVYSPVVELRCRRTIRSVPKSQVGPLH